MGLVKRGRLDTVAAAAIVRASDPGPAIVSGGGGLGEDARERLSEVVGVALDDRGLGEAALQELAEFRVELDEDQPVLRDAAADQGVGYRAGAGAELQDRARNAGIHESRHGPGEGLAGRRDGTHDEGALEPGSQKPGLVFKAVLTEGQLLRPGPLERLEHKRILRDGIGQVL